MSGPERAAPKTVVIGVGNPYRRDDGIGPAVIERLRTGRDRAGMDGVTLAVTDGEPTRLLDLWTGAELAVVVDAVRTELAAPGQVLELVADQVPESPTASSHGVGFGTAVELGRLLDRMPRRLVVYAVAGEDFGAGTGLSPPVEHAVGEVVDRIVRTLRVAGKHGR